MLEACWQRACGRRGEEESEEGTQERERELGNWQAEGGGVTKGSKDTRFVNKGGVQTGAKENWAGGVAANWQVWS